MRIAAALNSSVPAISLICVIFLLVPDENSGHARHTDYHRLILVGPITGPDPDRTITELVLYDQLQCDLRPLTGRVE